jgi:hypothetical protein
MHICPSGLTGRKGYKISTCTISDILPLIDGDISIIENGEVIYFGSKEDINQELLSKIIINISLLSNWVELTTKG